MSSLIRAQRIQPKLTVSHPDDEYEREADRVADQVMRMSAPQISRKCTKCEEKSEHTEEPEGKKALVQAKRESGDPPEASSELQSYLASNHGGGQPLTDSTRDYFESSFGHNFGHVRVHTDSKASAAAAQINAYAFTIGSDIYFGAGRYQTGTAQGDRLLGHELTHVVQQRNGTTGIIRRTCGERSITRVVAAGGGCSRFDPSGFVNGLGPFRFNVRCDDFATEQEKALLDSVRGLPAGATFEIHGFASVDGKADFNTQLGCARALKAEMVIRGAGFGARITGIVNHGATRGVAADRRSVVLRTSKKEDKEDKDKKEEKEEVCRDFLGKCEYYLCRDRKHPCGDRGYYRGYGHKYCERFSTKTRPKMTLAGQDWLDCVRVCLQEHLEQKVPSDADCDTARDSAVGSHARCYVRCGICSLPGVDLERIRQTIDPEDSDTGQVLETAARCLLLPSPPATRGFQLACVIRLGGCPHTRPGGIPTPEEIKAYNQECRRETGYTGDDVVPTDEDCERAVTP